jgi:hypothetical protein
MLRDAPVLRAERALLKAKSAGPPPRAAGEIGACGRRRRGYGAGEVRPMHFPHFLRIERDAPGPPRHYVVHTRRPIFAMELAPDPGAPDQIGRGLLKRICVPNSWAGDYQKYFRLMTAAQNFFAASFGAAEPKSVTRRAGV